MISLTTQFSLFEGDLFNRIFSRLKLGGRRPTDILGRIGVLLLLTWVPMAILACIEHLGFNRPPAENFFYDLAAYAQCFIGLPLFVMAESQISLHTREGAKRFASSGVLGQEDAQALENIHLKVEELRKNPDAEVLCMFFAFFVAFITLMPHLFDAKNTWHAVGPLGNQHFTATGVWAILVDLPIINFIWIRWVWKIMLWCFYLYKVSRFRLTLVASHPDRTGGIGFLSEVQSKFGLLILAYGASNVMATVAYEIVIQKMTVDVMTVWGPIVSFVIGAPLLFTIPLFLFTKQLYRTKKRALEIYEEKAMERAKEFESRWLHACQLGQYDVMGGNELAGLNNLTAVFERIHGMRVVPFDLRSFGELVGSAIGPILPLLPYLHVIPEPVMKAIEESLKFFHH